jgi:hypothetical protein
MIHDDIRLGNLPQCLAFMTVLPARPLAGRLPQALNPRRLVQPVARRWLAAVRTVQPQTPLKFGDLCFQRCNFGSLRYHQRNQFFP